MDNNNEVRKVDFSIRKKIFTPLQKKEFFFFLLIVFLFCFWSPDILFGDLLTELTAGAMYGSWFSALMLLPFIAFDFLAAPFHLFWVLQQSLTSNTLGLSPIDFIYDLFANSGDYVNICLSLLLVLAGPILISLISLVPYYFLGRWVSNKYYDSTYKVKNLFFIFLLIIGIVWFFFGAYTFTLKSVPFIAQYNAERAFENGFQGYNLEKCGTLAPSYKRECIQQLVKKGNTPDVCSIFSKDTKEGIAEKNEGSYIFVPKKNDLGYVQTIDAPYIIPAGESFSDQVVSFCKAQVAVVNDNQDLCAPLPESWKLGCYYDMGRCDKVSADSRNDCYLTQAKIHNDVGYCAYSTSTQALKVCYDQLNLKYDFPTPLTLTINGTTTSSYAYDIQHIKYKIPFTIAWSSTSTTATCNLVATYSKNSPTYSESVEAYRNLPSSGARQFYAPDSDASSSEYFQVLLGCNGSPASEKVNAQFDK